eukprot:2853214-Pyramimonas_sp.AAC.1
MAAPVDEKNPAIRPGYPEHDSKRGCRETGDKRLPNGKAARAAQRLGYIRNVTVPKLINFEMVVTEWKDVQSKKRVIPSQGWSSTRRPMLN